MKHFDKHCGYALSILCLALLFLPKINLLSFEGRETAGIRVDDLVLFGFSIIFLWAHIALKKRFFDIEKTAFLILGFSLLSSFVNILLYTSEVIPAKGSVLYALRTFEYFFFFYAGILASRYFNLRNVLAYYFMLTAVVMIFQKFGMIGGFSNEGYRVDTARTIGLASFPSEMGAILNLLFCYLLYTGRVSKFESRAGYHKEGSICRLPFLNKEMTRVLVTLFPYFFFLFTAMLIVMTGSRIAILAHVVSFMPYLKRELSIRHFGKAVIAIIAITLSTGAIAYTISQNEYTVRRSEGLFSWKNLELGKTVWKHIDVKENPMGNEVVKRSKEEDHSWWIRIHKWMYALKIYATHPEVYLQGVGPGFAMAALDGGLLRILVEQGIIGMLLYARFFYLIAKESLALQMCIVVFLINMLFFDVYLAYKAMTLLLLMAGFSYGNRVAKPLQE